MSLLDEFARRCVRMKPQTAEDGAGGRVTTWTEDFEFTACLARNASIEARRAEKQGVSSVYDALVNQSVRLAFGDYFRDAQSGETWRVTSNPEEKRSPACSMLPLKHFTAERKELPT